MWRADPGGSRSDLKSSEHSLPSADADRGAWPTTDRGVTASRVRSGSLVVPGLVLAVVYALTVKGGLSVAFAHPSATAVWPPAGIALAACLFWGYRIWPAIF